MKTFLTLSLLALVAAVPALADGPAPVREVGGIAPKKTVFDAVTGPAAPLELRSAKEAVLIFAWQGSGGDRITFEVGESNPPRADFTLHRGRTRDLVPHAKVFAIPAGAKWAVK